MNKPTFNTSNIDYIYYIKVLWRKIWIIILAAIIGGASAFAYTYFTKAPQYQSSAKLFVNEGGISLGSTSVKISAGDIVAGQKYVSTYIAIAKSRPTLEAVIDEMELPYSYGTLNGMLSIGVIEDTAILKLTITSESPEEACQIVNTIARLLPEKISEIVDGTSARIIEMGVINTAPIGPDFTKYTLIGLLVGAVLAAAIIILLDMSDMRIYDESFLERLPRELPLLAAIPDLAKSSGKKYGYKTYQKQYGENYKKEYGYYSDYSDKKSDENDQKAKNKDQAREYQPKALLCNKMGFAASEAYKLLRTNVMYSLIESDDCKVIGITSAMRGEGKSTTAINLSYNFAKTGKRILLIEADMRLPSISKNLGIANEKGLSSVLSGQEKYSDAVMGHPQYKNWELLTAGPIPPNPSEMLGSSRMESLIEGCKKVYDYIFIDFPPVNVVADAMTLSKILDGYILVCREYYSDYPAIEEAVRQLDFTNSNLLGCVLTCSYSASKTGRYKYRSVKRSGYGNRYYNYDYRNSYRYGYRYAQNRYDNYYRNNPSDLNTKITPEDEKTDDAQSDDQV